MRARQPASELSRNRPLVRPVPEREEQAHSDRLGVDLGQRGEVELFEHPVRSDPLAHAEAALDRDERLRMVLAQPIEVRSRLAPQMEKVLEAGGCQERCSRALPLQQRVGRDRGPVGEALDVRGPDRASGLHHRLLLRRASGHLRRRHAPAVEQNRIGERPADVDAEHGHAPILANMRAWSGSRPSSPPPLASSQAATRASPCPAPSR